jgi:hypothetical protein
MKHIFRILIFSFLLCDFTATNNLNIPIQAMQQRGVRSSSAEPISPLRVINFTNDSMIVLKQTFDTSQGPPKVFPAGRLRMSRGSIFPREEMPDENKFFPSKPFLLLSYVLLYAIITFITIYTLNQPIKVQKDQHPTVLDS